MSERNRWSYFKNICRRSSRHRLASLLLAAVFMMTGTMTSSAGPAGSSQTPVQSGELRGVWISYLDWNKWPKDYNGFRQAVDLAMDTCAANGMKDVYKRQSFRIRIFSGFIFTLPTMVLDTRGA